ncbi:MAG: hypothetical protein HS101_07950 [Planctomycetia bacterium]|nr:hypothetical protein [Planctomycetia bacterium]
MSIIISVRLYRLPSIEHSATETLEDQLKQHTLANPDVPQLEVKWGEPVLHRGFWEGFVEWIGVLQVSTIPAATLANLLASYLWELVVQGREQLVGGKTTGKRGHPQIPFSKAGKVKIVVTKASRRIEFDPYSIERDTLMPLIDKFLNDS